jgi:hypothetical protein
MLSRIPIIGLAHLVNITRKRDVDDGAGGIDAGEPLTVYANQRGRIAAMTDEDEQLRFGNVTGQRWSVVMIYSPDIKRQDFLSLSPASIEAPIDRCNPDNGKVQEYRINYVKKQIDDGGAMHHTSLVIELEDQNT